jgi:hypothetical protein
MLSVFMLSKPDATCCNSSISAIMMTRAPSSASVGSIIAVGSGIRANTCIATNAYLTLALVLSVFVFS